VNIELIIESKPTEVVIALLKDKKLTELHRERGNNNFSVGDIYLGKTRKVVPGLNAAFVDVGYEKDAFLHYLDLGPQFASLNKFVKRSITGKQLKPELANFRLEKDIPKDGKINNLLSGSQNILVQIAKEPISSKGPRLSSEITLAGRFIVLVPFSTKISISQKVRDAKERERLRRLMTSIKPKNFGVIIRTVAQNKKVAELDQDLRDLVSKWEAIHKGLRSSKPPKKILGELSRTSALLRDLLSAKFTGITVNDAAFYEEVKTYIKSIEPGREKIIKHYSGKAGIFEHFGIQKQIKASFGKQVSMPSGAYLIIEHTEAMHVIDVNSGNRKSGDRNQEENALSTNMEAAEEVARLLRLRDMGGIIVIDFIDMSKRENNRKLFEHLKDQMKDDRAKHNILAPSRFGVVEITRQRVRPETNIKTAETCPACNGTGEVQATILLIDEIENNLRYLIEEKKTKSVHLNVHPFVEAYLKKGLISQQRKWFLAYKKWIPVNGITANHLLEYNFVNPKGEEIDMT
jgi:ribonuclease G